MKGIFITGTDTGAGKTVITGLLARYLSDKGYGVITQKWVQTGSKIFSSDIAAHLKLMKRRREDIKDYLAHISPYVFRFASSPHLAASLEKKRIKEERIKESYKFLSKRSNFVLVEGIGGALVPLNKKRLVIDLAKELGMPVLIVSENKLGAINHTLLTIEAIKKRNMKIMGVVFNNKSSKINKIISKDNPKIVKMLTGEPILGTLPRLKDRELLYKAFIPIARKIARKVVSTV
jgi:dethiobiotin synthetase